MIFLSRLCHALDKRQVPYALVGGHAVALHGAVRGTVDIDFAIRWNLKNLTAAVNALADIGLQSRLPICAEDVFNFREEYIANRNLIAWRFFNPANLAEQVDLMVAFDLAGKKTLSIDIGAQPVQLLSRNDLIKMKRAAGRPQDLEDAAALEKLP